MQLGDVLVMVLSRDTHLFTGQEHRESESANLRKAAFRPNFLNLRSASLHIFGLLLSPR